MKSFASDNYAGVLPEVMDALAAANQGHARSYGADEITLRTVERFREVFGTGVDVYFVFNGTGANVLSAAGATHTHNSVLCADISHFYNDESSAPETFTGCRFFPLPTNEQGKLELPAIRSRLIRQGDVHYAQPAALSVTQSTEYGTLYTADELSAIGDLCRENGLYFHMDGSRFFNAAAGMNCGFGDISTHVGLDLLSLGGTKAGMMFGEAVVVFNERLKAHIAYKQKQAMQLHSKTRFIAAQFEAMLKDGLWLRTAGHANAMARMLYEGVRDMPQVKVTRPVQANVVFAELPSAWNEPLMRVFPFYVWKETTNEVRLMCAWDTTKEDIKLLVSEMKKLA